MPIQVLRTFSVTARSAFVSLHDGSALQPSPHLPRLAAGDILPTRRDSRGASPWRASFRFFSPPQSRSLFPPPAAVATLPLWKRLGRCFVVTPPDAPLPVGIPSVSLCRRARSARPAVTACSGRYLPAALLGAVCSHASHACAAGRHLLRLSMCARRFAPNAHASLRICLPAYAARTLYVVTPRTRVRPVDICCDSACAPGALRRTLTLCSAYVSLHTRLGRCM